MLIACLAGCMSSGPNYKSPQTAVAGSFGNAPASAASPDEKMLGVWWKGFHDAKLDSLIEHAIKNNHDLRIATANLKEARALRQLKTFDLAPTVTANSGYTNTLISRAAAPAGASRDAREAQLFDAGFDASWELDLFGRVRRSVKAANADVEAFEATRFDVLVSVISEVARNYFELHGLQNQLAVARKNAEVQKDTLKLNESRLQGGRGTEFDVERSRSLLNLTLASIPPLEGAIQKTIYRISVLMGEQPLALKAELSNPELLPSVLPEIAIGDPAALLRRRPDIRAAERSLASTTEKIGIATADLFPRVTFVGSMSVQADTFSGLTKGAGAYNFGPRITWAALDLGRVRSRIKAAHIRAEAALASYERTVLAALEETEGALVDFGEEKSKEQFLEASSQAAQKAADLARQRYDAGSADYLSVLDAQRTLLEAQDRLAASQTRTVTSLVAVYKALGGYATVKEVR